MHYRIPFIFVTFILPVWVLYWQAGHKMLTQTNLQSLLFLYSETPKKYEIADIKVDGC